RRPGRGRGGAAGGGLQDRRGGPLPYPRHQLRALPESRQGHQRHRGPGAPHRGRRSPAEELGGDQDDESSQGLPGCDASGSGELQG
ncbi:unnamed protein product, partial [Ectocarpus fasciculatus]